MRGSLDFGQEVHTIESFAGLGEFELGRGRQELARSEPIPGFHSLEELSDDCTWVLNVRTLLRRRSEQQGRCNRDLAIVVLISKWSANRKCALCLL